MKSTKVLLLTVAVLILVCINPSTAAIPVANFTGTPITGPAPLIVSFTDQSTGSPTGWAWYFGDENYTAPWTQVNASAGWVVRSDHSSVVLPDGSIVLMGGYGGILMNDVWRSTDNGSTWKQMNASAGWTGRHYHTSVALPDGSIVLMGGYDGQGINGYYNDTWRSTDNGSTWKQMNASSGWSQRAQHSCVALPDGSIVLMGGSGPDGETYKNDTWRSTDNGSTWTQITSHAKWPARTLHRSVTMSDGSIVLMGGQIAGDTYVNDVWRSTDNGTTWIEMNISAGWTPRTRFSSVTMPDGSIVLMGGAEGDLNDTWRLTNNGVTWTQLTEHADWSARYSHSSVAMPDGSIVLMGGRAADGWKNDVWRFTPAGSSAQNPSHTYVVPGMYNVSLQIYNVAGYNSTRKAGYITVTVPVAPITIFSGIPASGTDPLFVTFNDTSTGFPTSWNWSFRNITPGNNTQIWFSTSPNPTHTFGVGNYSIVLNASNSIGYNLSAQVTFINVTSTPVNLTSTIGIYRNGVFYLRNSNTGGIADMTFGYGNLAGDVPLAGDWDGNGIDTIGVYRNGVFYLRNSNTNGIADIAFWYGNPTGDIPIVGDWNGDLIDTIGVYRNGVFYLRNSNTNGIADLAFTYGQPGDVPVIGNWTGSGVDTVGVYRNGVFYLRNSNTGGIADIVFGYGNLAGDTPVVGDWTGSGKDTIGVYRNGVFYLRNSNTNGIADLAFTYGQLGDVPVTGDWTGT